MAAPAQPPSDPRGLHGADATPSGRDAGVHPDLVVICTRNRPREIEMSAAAVQRSSPGKPLLILDASSTEATREACERLRGRYPSVTYRRARQTGLARQRNEALEVCREIGAEIVHFIDDDTEVRGEYFDAIVRGFADDPSVVGIGGVILNQPPVGFVRLKSLFLLGSRRTGSVLRSGRNVLGQYPGSSASDRVEWLSGCSMSYRTSVFDRFTFDGDLSAYSMGEDYDFSFRVSRDHRLAVAPGATCVHHVTPTLRNSSRAHARLRTEATHRWVKRHRSLGMSPVAFWWSTLGDFVLNAGYGALKLRREPLGAAVGVLHGAITIASRAATR